ncbi:MAG: flagellar basal body P-ring formation protein FlgA [Cellvibrionaceae bacterium]|nr:flagellar basal body P-ring formation protein FlgA [Cellvibrionaceae bacterium]
MKSGNFLLAFCLLLSPLNTTANDYMSLQIIEENVSRFIQEYLVQQLDGVNAGDIHINTRPIDPRLKLARCDKPLTLARGNLKIQRNVSIKVSCSDQWSLYVGNTITIERAVVVARAELPRLHILGEADLTDVKKNIFTLRGGYHTERSALLGQQLKRPVSTGAVVYNYLLQAPDIVKKGDRVTVISQRGALQVTAPGIALGNGSQGEKIRIENQRSSRIIQAKIIGPGTVEIIL